MPRISKLRIFVLVVILAIITVFLANPPDRNLHGKRWTLVAYGESGSMMPVVKQASLYFKDETHLIGGGDGCNSVRSPYRTLGSTIFLFGYGQTVMYCGEPVQDQTRTIRNVLWKRGHSKKMPLDALFRLFRSPRFHIEGDVLTIRRSNQLLIYEFNP